MQETSVAEAYFGVYQVSVTRPKERLQQVETAISKNVCMRLQGLCSFLTVLQLFNYSDSPWMLESGMRVESNPLTISGRALPSPGVVYGNVTMVCTIFSQHITSLISEPLRTYRPARGTWRARRYVRLPGSSTGQSSCSMMDPACKTR